MTGVLEGGAPDAATLDFAQPGVAEGHWLAAEIQRIVRTNAENNPRSRQVMLGASEYGMPCARKLAARVFGLPKLNGNDGWYSTIGTGVHAELGAMFAADAARWMTDIKVSTGTLDVFDLATNSVVDFKVVGKTALERYRRKGHPGEQYRTQVHLYGDGMAELGASVDSVVVAFLGRCNPLTDQYIWSEPYDPAVGAAARDRLALITELGIAAGLDRDDYHTTGALRAFPTADDHCNFCPWFSYTDQAGCPGHKER